MRSSLLDIHSTTTAQWEKLPPELIHDIFHYAARLSTEFSLTLCGVSSWTRRLALPHLYTTVILKNYYLIHCYTQCLEKPPFIPPQYNFEPKTALRSLWMGTVFDCVVSIFQECDNLVHLALHAYNFFYLVQETSNADCCLSHDAITRKGDLHLVILKCHSRRLTSNLNSPLLSKITHFQLADAGDYQEELIIAHFTRLTHLCVPFWLPIHDLSVLDRILDENHHPIESLVVAVYMDLVKDDDLLHVRNWFEEKRGTDRRVHLVDSRSDEIQKEWEREVRGGESIWSRALRSTGTLQNGI